MNVSFKKLWNDYGIGSLIVLLVVAYGVSMFVKYISSKGSYGYEAESSMPPQYGSGASPGVEPSVAADMDGDYAPANGMQSNNKSTAVQNPADLLPSEASSSSWAELNPKGKGELANINLLKAGYHVGINTVGQSRTYRFVLSLPIRSYRLGRGIKLQWSPIIRAEQWRLAEDNNYYM